MHPDDINKGITSPTPKGSPNKLPIIQHYDQKRATASTPTTGATQHPPIWQVLKRIRWPAFGMLMTYIVTH